MAAKKKTGSSGKKNSVVIANNDIVYLWWSLDKPIKNCLGFSIRRIIDGKEEKSALIAGVGFDKQKDTRQPPQTTDEWPIQSFNWKDVSAPHDKEVAYRITPMLMTGKSWKKLTPDSANSIVTNTVRRSAKYGKDTKVIFNRGLLSTQAVAKGQKHIKASDMIVDPQWRKRLAGEMLQNIGEFFNQPQLNGGGKFYAALYELTDTDLIGHIKNAPKMELILSNADKSETKMVNGKRKTIPLPDETNKNTRTDLQNLMKQKNTFKIHDRMLGSHIGHNKFVVYVDEKGKPKSVLTGSTNWTSTGLCGQTNNLVIIDNPKMATKYLDYWKELLKDKKQDAALRTWCEGNCYDSKTGVKVWYSPNTKQKNKPKNPTAPVDIQEVFNLIERAKKSILFLVFNPGSPSIINKIKEVSGQRKLQNKPLFVRGAISDATLAKKVVTEIYSTNALDKPDKYKVGDEEITGVAAIPGPFSYWEKELLTLGYATIHDKVLVIDPFEKDSIVITGSHNLGYKASYTNDENMVIIKGNPEIAKAYAAHVLDVVNHFKWRYKLQSKIQKAGIKPKDPKKDEKIKKILESAWHDLDETPVWLNYYFGPEGFIDQYRLFLP
jgi:phosphatidylserine/phosphatidylglycerophosphate/cardiolipin synthase-like enzyme